MCVPLHRESEMITEKDNNFRITFKLKKGNDYEEVIEKMVEERSLQ